MTLALKRCNNLVFTQKLRFLPSFYPVESNSTVPVNTRYLPMVITVKGRKLATLVVVINSIDGQDSCCEASKCMGLFEFNQIIDNNYH